MFHAAPRTGGGIAAQKQRHFAQLLRGDKLPGGLFSASSWALLRVDPLGDAFVDLLLHQGLAPSGADGVAGDAARAVSGATVLVSPTTACLAAT